MHEQFHRSGSLGDKKSGLIIAQIQRPLEKAMPTILARTNFHMKTEEAVHHRDKFPLKRYPNITKREKRSINLPVTLRFRITLTVKRIARSTSKSGSTTRYSHQRRLLAATSS